MRSRRLLGLIGVVALAFVAAAILLPHSPTDLRAMLLGAGLAAPAIALAAWILLTPAMFSGALLAAASGLAFGAPGGAAVAVGGAVRSLPDRPRSVPSRRPRPFDPSGP